MVRKSVIWIVVLLGLFAGQSALSQSDGFLTIHHTDDFEIVFGKERGTDTIFARGNVIFETRTGMIYCDSAAWAMGSDVWLRGRVIIEDERYRLAADDSVHYDLSVRQAQAGGDYVELWSYDDSLMAVGTQAFFDRNRDYFYMLNRPTVYLNYPDSASMVEVIADVIEYDARGERADAEGNVRINSKDMNATAGCAVMRPKLNTLDLFEDPVVIRNQSEISGKLISILSEDGNLKRVDVVDSARGLFVEPTDSTESDFDRSRLSGDRIVMDFVAGDLSSISCRGQAYSWYNPSPRGKKETVENTVSGDSIRLTIEYELLKRVDVIGGSIGTYFSTTESVDDSVVTTHTDTIDYSAHHIVYNLADSLITLNKDAKTTSSLVELSAYQIELDTRERVIEAYSGEVSRDTVESGNRFVEELQPNPIPVVLRDGDEVLHGDYLKYSIDTEKGRIVTSKSKYETGFFYGDDLYRQDRDVFYLEDGRYTTCDADEPHFHFHSKHLKLIEGDRLIAKPVVLNIGRLPILALPYYVFPLKKGRHSGFLPFTLGNIERGERYIRNVGYYWAASDYWDWEGALDYIEDRSRLNIYNKVTYNKLYTFDGSLSGNYGTETRYIYTGPGQGRENRETRWTVSAKHNHTFSPSFKISATGDVRSDPTYYQDFSTDLEQRLNRVVRSKLTFSKKFGRSVSVSGTVSHDDYLDERRRVDQLPNMNIALPRWNPFGSGSLNEEGVLERHWYNELIVSYSPSLLNYSTRNTIDSIINVVMDTTITADTNIVVDTVTMIPDTTIIEDTVFTLVSQDTLSTRTRREYSKINHTAGISFPTKLARYIVFSPSFNYYETWYKIHPTDQSDSAGLDVSTTYRSYYYNMGASVSTTVYGTVYPNVFGLVGFRQVIQPSVSYTYTPKNDHHPDIRQFAGGGAASTSKSQRMTIRINQLYQAKIRRDEVERNLELISITSSLSHDFERETRKFSNLSTTFNSNVLPKIRLNGNMTHSLYRKDSDDLDFWHPRLTDFSLNTSVSLTGRNFLFDDAPPALPQGADSASQLTSGGPPRTGSGNTGWSLSASYGFSETGIDTDFYDKKSFLTFSLRFNLTPSTRITYSQSYDFERDKTVTNRVNIERTIHCWTGTFHWVPTGSTRGWGFRLFVTAIPAIKIDNSQNTLSSSYYQELR